MSSANLRQEVICPSANLLSIHLPLTTPVEPLHKAAVRTLRQNAHFSLLLFLPQADIDVTEGWHLLHHFDHVALLQLLPVLLRDQIVQPACCSTLDSIVTAGLEQLDQRVDQPGFPRFQLVLIVIGRQVAQSRGGQALRLFRADISVCSAEGGASAKPLQALHALDVSAMSRLQSASVSLYLSRFNSPRDHLRPAA